MLLKRGADKLKLNFAGQTPGQVRDTPGQVRDTPGLVKDSWFGKGLLVW